MASFFSSFYCWIMNYECSWVVDHGNGCDETEMNAKHW